MSTRLTSGMSGVFPGNYWWLAVLRGFVALLFGIAVLFRPGISLSVLLMLFGAYALASGILAVISSVSLGILHKRWWAMLAEGLVGILIGFITFFWPVATVMAVLVLVAIWAIVTGALQIAASVSRFGPAAGSWLFGIGGVLSVALGVLLIAYPGVGILTLTLFLGIWAIVFGVDQIVHGFEERHLDRWIEAHMRPIV